MHISKQTVLAKLFQRAKLFVWDEVPMTIDLLLNA